MRDFDTHVALFSGPQCSEMDARLYWDKKVDFANRSLTSSQKTVLLHGTIMKVCRISYDAAGESSWSHENLLQKVSLQNIG